MGTLAGGIAHDFNNILAPILGFSELVLEQLPPDSQEHADLRVVHEAAQRGRDIVSQILIFSRKSEGHHEEFDLREHIGEAVRFLRSTLPKTIVIKESITPEPVFVHGDTAQINQVLINLTVNARQAMPNGGVLSVALDRVPLDDFECYLGKRISGVYVRLSISDSGVGIEPTSIPHIFEPFYTTKPVGEGTGLGLSTVLGVVEQHEGALNVISTPGEGTTFEVYLKAREPTVRKAPRPSAPSPAGTESILLIDDEAPIMRLGCRVLEAFGYQVTAFTSPLAALNAFRDDPGRFNLVITDQMMDGMLGETLVGELRRIREDIPIILCTGFSESITPERMRQLGLNGFYHKPITAEGLGGVVRRALGEEGFLPN
jgi:CheY-like chemotaxis protein